MYITWRDSAFRLTGRWSRLEKDIHDPHYFKDIPCKAAVTTAPGSSFELAFEGDMVLLHFELLQEAYPAPHLWLSLDGGARFEAQVDRYIRVAAPAAGKHILQVYFKGAMEMQHRWYAPQIGRVALLGADVPKPGVLPADNRPLIEFVGDSITEGVLIDTDYDTVPAHKEDQMNRPYQDDNLAAYGFLTAKALNMRYMCQAYGASGMTRVGCGGIPRAALVYPYVFERCPYTGDHPDVIVINHGCNDRNNPEDYLTRYEEFLDQAFLLHPNAVIIALSAFIGAYDKELSEFIPAYAEKKQARVYFVSSKGWVPAEPLHPMRDGHRAIADHFIPLVKDILVKEGVLK